MKRPTKLRGEHVTLAQARDEYLAAEASGENERKLVHWGGTLRKFLGTSRPGDIVVVGARTNVGKSHFTVKSLRETRHPSLYVSLEDDIATVVVRTDDVDQEADARITVATPVPIVLSQVVAHIELAALTVPPDVGWIVALDYIQLLQYDGDIAMFSQTQAIASAIAELRALGRELGFCLLVTAQISRPPKGRKSKDDDGEEIPRPTLFDLKDSSSIENAATDVILLHGAEDWMEAYVAKRKRGKVAGYQFFERGPQGRLISR